VVAEGARLAVVRAYVDCSDRFLKFIEYIGRPATESHVLKSYSIADTDLLAFLDPPDDSSSSEEEFEALLESETELTADDSGPDPDVERYLLERLDVCFGPESDSMTDIFDGSEDPSVQGADFCPDHLDALDYFDGPPPGLMPDFCVTERELLELAKYWMKCQLNDEFFMWSYDCAFPSWMQNAAYARARIREIASHIGSRKVEEACEQVGSEFAKQHRKLWKLFLEGEPCPAAKSDRAISEARYFASDTTQP
jgi:hypothetical protein